MRCLTAAIILFSYSTLKAQISPEWVARHSEFPSGYNGPNSIAVDGSANIYITGVCDGGNNGIDILTVKYSPYGNLLWSARFNGSANSTDEAYAVVLDDENNLYVSGKTTGLGTNEDFILIKYSTSGQLAWTSTYNGPGNNIDAVRAMTIDNNMNLFVTGYSTGQNLNTDYATIKYTTSGQLMWVSRFDGPAGTYDDPFAIAADLEGNVFVTGLSRGLGTKRDFATLKYDSQGNLLWEARYDGPASGYDMAYAIALDLSGCVYVTGPSWDWETGYDFAVVKYSPGGQELWVFRYDGGGYGSDEPRDIETDFYGNAFVTGRMWSQGFNMDYATVKLNNYGIPDWIVTYNGPGNNNDEATSMALDTSGNIYVTGFSRNGSNFGTEDFLTIMYSMDGSLLWTSRYNGQSDKEDIATEIIIDKYGDVVVSGSSRNNNVVELTTLKYSQAIGIAPVTTRIPDKYNIYQNYPNPFNPVTKIRVDVPSDLKFKNHIIKLVIYDILGNEVTVLIDRPLDAGAFELEWDASDEPSGIYFCRLSTGNYTGTVKMVLLK